MKLLDQFSRLNNISSKHKASILAMFLEFELAPGEVPADRYDPADEAEQSQAQVSPAELAEWEATPWF